MKVCIVLPTYNEAPNIQLILDGVLKHDVHVLVVDDTSPDGTAEIVSKHKEFGKRIFLLMGKKKGLGVAYRRGFSWVLKNKYDMLFEMDADMSHNPSLIPRFLEEIQRADIVIGSRYIKGGRIVGWNWKRTFISWAANQFVHLFVGIPAKDTTSGYRCMKTSFVRTHLKEFQGDGYGFQISVLFAARKLVIKEIPITFKDRQKGKSKLGSNDIVGFVGIVFRLFVQRFL